MAIAASLAAATLMLGGCSGGSSAVTSGAPVPTSPPVSERPQQPPAHAALAVARRYLIAVAERDDARASALSAASGGDASGRLDRLASRLQAIRISRAAGDASAASLPSSAPSGDRAVTVALRARLAGKPPSAWVPLGTRALLLAPEGGRWRVADDISGHPGLSLQPTGLAVLGNPHVLRGPTATVVYGPASARRQAAEIRRLADAAAPDLHGTYGGGAAAAHPLIFLVDDAAQAEQLIGRDVGQVLPAGSVTGPFAYVFLRQYRRIDPVSRGGLVTALMTHLATATALKHAPTSLRAFF